MFGPHRLTGDGIGYGAIQVALDRVSYKEGWKFRVVEYDLVFGIQVKDPASPVWGRMWVIMPHHTRDDVVRTAFLAIAAVEEHERREAFKVDGETLWDPHAPVLKEIHG